MSWLGTRYKNPEDCRARVDAALWAWQMLFCEGYPRRLEIEGEYYE